VRRNRLWTLQQTSSSKAISLNSRKQVSSPLYQTPMISRRRRICLQIRVPRIDVISR
jgi:hypothetical protein